MKIGGDIHVKTVICTEGMSLKLGYTKNRAIGKRWLRKLKECKIV